MISMKKTLDHAIKLPDKDYLRNLGQMGPNNWSQKMFLWLSWSIKPILRLFVYLVVLPPRNIRHDYDRYEWIIMNDHRGHVELFMQGLMNGFSDLSSVLFISLNSNLKIIKTGQDHQINKFTSIGIKSLFEALKYSTHRREKFLKLGVWGIPAFLTHVLDSSRIIEACKFYSQIKFLEKAKLITLCDSHWHQSVVTSQFRDRELITFTCMHGTPSEWGDITPFLSDYVLSWGVSMSNSILRNCDEITANRLINIGNFKYINTVDSQREGELMPTEITEIVFISPCYNITSEYGFDGLEREIRKFINLSIPSVSIAIRPYPDGDEIKFVENLIKNMGLSHKVKILTNSDFNELVLPGRLFVGSVSSAIADVIILGGAFVGLCEEVSRELAQTMPFYDEDIYFDILGLEKFIIQLLNETKLQKHLTFMSEIKDSLLCPPVDEIDLHLIDCIKAHQ